MRSGKSIVAAAIFCFWLAPVSAQNFRIYHSPGNYRSNGPLGRSSLLGQSEISDHDRLMAFGRCTVARDPGNSFALAIAYRQRAGEQNVVRRLQPVLAACYKQTRAPHTYVRNIRMAAIADALRERAAGG